MPRSLLFRPLMHTAVAGLVVMLLALDGCSYFNEPPPPKKPVAANTGAQPYLQNLSLAHESLDETPDNVEAAAPYVAKLNRYALKKGAHASTPLTVVLLGFRTKEDGKSHKLIVPVGGTTKAPDLSNLREATHVLASHRPEYRTIHIRSVTVTNRDAVPVHAKASDVASKVNDLYETVAESAVTPPKLDAARLQIALARFFMGAGIRDAAYVSLENAKDLLANADTSRQEDADEVQNLSSQLETLENTLHKKMPYTF